MKEGNIIPIRCNVRGKCFARTKDKCCYLLSEPAYHHGRCAFQKEFIDKPKGWRPVVREVITKYDGRQGKSSKALCQ